MPYPPQAFERRYSKSSRGPNATQGEDKSDRERDKRSDFARDRDRLLYSREFQRLAGKSQVVASTEIGPFHTRLTHSLKVAQLGRRLAEQLRAEEKAKSKDMGDAPETSDGSADQVYAPDPDLVEFACLAHDIGHPPFGHAGERELNKTVRRLLCGLVNEEKARERLLQVFGGFEGNPQSFRIVTRLAHKAGPKQPAPPSEDAAPLEAEEPAEFFGLDLTAAAIDAVSKYPWPYGSNSAKLRKWGAYGSDADEHCDVAALVWARKQTGAPTDENDRFRQSFECQLMDWCDDVTYAVHDVEDFFMVGMIPLERIFDYEDLFHSLDAPKPSTTPSVEEPDSDEDLDPSKYPLTREWKSFRLYVQEDWSKSSNDEGQQRQYDNKYLNQLRDDLIDNAYGSTGWKAERDSVIGQRMSQRRASDLIAHFAGNNVGYSGIPMLHEGKLKLSRNESDKKAEDESRKLRDQCDLLKALIWKYVIRLPGLATQQAGQRRIIRDLVTIIAEDPGEEPDPLPGHYVELVKNGSGCDGMDFGPEITDRCARVRVTADYVASLTEAQAVAMHKRLTGIELGGFRDIF